ncbi:4064_t:CDS:1, partial [Paraglomus occultum]
FEDIPSPTPSIPSSHHRLYLTYFRNSHDEIAAWVSDHKRYWSCCLDSKSEEAEN